MGLLASAILFAQQNNNAYESGRMVGQITAYVAVGAVALWVLGKLIRK